MIKNRGQFSKPAPFNYQSHQSLQKFRKVAVQQRAEQLTQDIFKVKIRGQQSSKYIARNSAPSKQQQVKQLRKHIKVIQGQLKRKILQNPILSRIFKTKQSTSSELSHLDLYLQFLKLKSQQQMADQRVEDAVEEYRKKQTVHQLDISRLKEQREQRQQEFVSEIQKATQKFQKLQQEFQKKINQKDKMFYQETIQRESKIQDSNLILEQLKRKNHKLSKQNKQLENKIAQSNNSAQEGMKGLKLELQSQRQQSSAQNHSHTQLIQKIKITNKQTVQALKRKISFLENQLAQKSLQIQQLDRFIQLQKQSFQTQMDQIKHSCETKISEIKSTCEQQLLRSKELAQKSIQKLLKQCQQKQKQIRSKAEDQLMSLKQLLRNESINSGQLATSLQDKQKMLNKIQSQVKHYKDQTGFEIQQIKGFNKKLIEDKQGLIRKLTQSQAKLQKQSKQLQHMTYQRNQLLSKYQKGSTNSQNDIKHLQTVIQQLQRKVYVLGNQNIGLRKSLDQRNSAKTKAEQFSRISQQTYQQKYKAIGRIQEIKHKLENYLMNDFARNSFACFNNTFSNCTSNSQINYKSNSHPQNSSLTQSLEVLTLLLDKLFENYFGLNQNIETCKKQRLQDQREIQSILNHFIDMEDRQEDLLEGLLNYINIRKELNKQSMTSQNGCGQEYLIDRKRQTCQCIIQKLIQLKVIRQYSSADQGFSSYRLPQQQRKLQISKKSGLDSYGSTNHYSSNSINNHNSLKSRKSLRKLIQDQKYRSIQQICDGRQYTDSSYKNDQFQSSHRRALFQNSQNLGRQRKIGMAKSRQSIRQNLVTRDSLNTKYRHRLSTQPIKVDEDIDQQSTYEIMDQNVNCDNFSKKFIQKKNILQKHYGSKQQAEEKVSFNKKYKDQIKQKLLGGKNKRQNNAGLSKQDIQKKYFMR